MKTTRLALTLTLACGVCACAEQVVTLKNEQSGAVAVCRASNVATGVTSQRVLRDLLTQCVDNYTQQGYSVVAATR